MRSRDGLKQLARYVGLVNPSVRLVFREEEDPIRVLVEGSTDPFTVELTVSLSVLRFSRESGDQLQVARICFATNRMMPARSGARSTVKSKLNAFGRDSL